MELCSVGVGFHSVFFSLITLHQGYINVTLTSLVLVFEGTEEVTAAERLHKADLVYSVFRLIQASTYRCTHIFYTVIDF